MYLLDTNALSEPLRRQPSPAFMRRLDETRVHAYYTSAICVMELRHGCSRRPDGFRLWRRIRDEVLARVEVIPVDASVAERAGDLLASLERRGQPRSSEDILIAATALTRRLVLVTHNRRHFADVPGLRVEDWM